ncbi:hypothetical protein [Methylobacterium sp. WL120]|uniref:hypothetical protein n=1 Tax=Methylobacterium sp. WL120 TaxID=2603887 RepID=UPI0011C8DEB5|nr:hypothetical protein [Methylobacterium sp. WL120]TXM69676.1 hypothetical protein FV229_04845 [Methylobacterium sp. WL120]
MAHIFSTPYEPPAERPSFLDVFDFDVASLAQDIQTQRICKRQASFERDDAEIEAIERSRPIGVDAPRVEPKSIDDPVPPSRLRFEAPRRRYEAPKLRKCAF